MSSENDDAAASNPAKRCRLPRVSDVNGNKDNRDNKDNHSAASSETTYVVRTTGAPVPPMIPVTISTPYVRPPNEPNTVKSLKGTNLEPLRELIAPLAERCTTTIVAQSRAALDHSSKIKQRESSYFQFTERVIRDEHGKTVTDARSGATITEDVIPRSSRDKNLMRCHDNAKEDNRISAVMQRMLPRRKKYKIEKAKGIQEVKKRLTSLFLDTAFKYTNVIHITYANVIHIMENTIRTIGTPLKTPSFAHRAVVHVLSLMDEEDRATLSTSRKTLFDAYTTQHGIDTTKLPRQRGDSTSKTIVNILKPILPVCPPRDHISLR